MNKFIKIIVFLLIMFYVLYWYTAIPPSTLNAGRVLNPIIGQLINEDYLDYALQRQISEIQEKLTTDDIVLEVNRPKVKIKALIFSVYLLSAVTVAVSMTLKTLPTYLCYHYGFDFTPIFLPIVMLGTSIYTTFIWSWFDIEVFNYLLESHRVDADKFAAQEHRRFIKDLLDWILEIT